MIDLLRFIDLFKPKQKQGAGLENSPENSPPDVPGFIVEKIKAINWSQYGTAYGNAAIRIPVYLEELFCSDKKLAM